MHMGHLHPQALRHRCCAERVATTPQGVASSGREQQTRTGDLELASGWPRAGFGLAGCVTSDSLDLPLFLLSHEQSVWVTFQQCR